MAYMDGDDSFHNDHIFCKHKKETGDKEIPQCTASCLKDIDSAWHYIENQLMIGRCMAKYPRENYILVGKLFFNDGTINTWEKAEAAFQKELNDARVEYNDLELMHAVGSEDDVARMDDAFDPSKPMYRNDFDQFLNDTYGIDPDPFETRDFEW